MIKVTNDGRGKAQSFEATLADLKPAHLWPLDQQYQGYGKNREEAVDQLRKEVEKVIKDLQSITWE
ncbi:hypothetical protein [Hymenobacter mellowenesis]|uniref:hypothetical protein n=1 Tax=Hymenobacter mellowenesis TaxID=3063995 RepID=UPI00272A4134|nr:hypothetical protein [Hymenobacter sp. M29]